MQKEVGSSITLPTLPSPKWFGDSQSNAALYVQICEYVTQISMMQEVFNSKALFQFLKGV